jgi:TRADD-N domain-containing protein
MSNTSDERKRVSEAVAVLARYNKVPFITEFLKRQPHPRITAAKYEKDELCSLIHDVLVGDYHGKKKYVLDIIDLLNHLDQLQETGRQHLYLFRWAESEVEAVLSRARDRTDLLKVLGDEKDLFGGRVVWEARSGPALAHVRYESPTESTPHGALLLKWIETREYWAPRKNADASRKGDDLSMAESDDIEHEVFDAKPSDSALMGTDTTERIQVRTRREERAASYCVINLETGDLQLRIQAVHGRSRAVRQEQLFTYRNLISTLFGAELVGPTVLAPAIRRVLVSKEVPIVHCSAILPDGGRFVGGKNELPPVDVSKLQAGVTIRFDWPQPSGGIGRIELDGRLDEILILRPLLPDQHRLLVDRVLQWRRESIEASTSNDLSTVKDTSEVGRTVSSAGQEEETRAVTRSDLVAILKSAFATTATRELASPPRTAIDQAIREYMTTHTVEETSEDRDIAVDLRSAAAAGDPRPLEQFLAYIQEVAKTERRNYEREVTIVRREEQWTSRLFLTAAVCALAIVVGGVILFFAEKVAIGTVTSAVGALTGGGTVLLRAHAKSLRVKRESFQSHQKESQETLLAIQTALSIPDLDERSKAMSAVASSLLGRVSTPAPRNHVQP